MGTRKEKKKTIQIQTIHKLDERMTGIFQNCIECPRPKHWDDSILDHHLKNRPASISNNSLILKVIQSINYHIYIIFAELELIPFYFLTLSIFQV